MHILIATDGSQQSLKAAQFLGTLVNPKNIKRVTVVAVIRPLAAVPFASDFSEEEAVGAGESGMTLSFRREAQAATQRVAEVLGESAAEVTTIIRSGSPADEIIRAADELSADLIVVGGRGKGTIGAIFMGSVAYRILHHAPCPVLVTR